MKALQAPQTVAPLLSVFLQNGHVPAMYFPLKQRVD